MKTETQPPAGILCTHGLCFTPVYYMPSGLNALWLVVFCYANPSFLMRISLMIYDSFYFIPTFSGMQLGCKTKFGCVKNIWYLHKYKKRFFYAVSSEKWRVILQSFTKFKSFLCRYFHDSWQWWRRDRVKIIRDDQHNCSVTDRHTKNYLYYLTNALNYTKPLKR